MADDTAAIGRRLREVRAWRGLSLRAAAQLAGFSASYLSMIERGERPIERRSTLEALSAALRVDPTDLTGQPYGAPTDPLSAEARAAVADLEVVLGDGALGDRDTAAGRPWPEVRAELDRLNRVLRPAADYVEQGRVLPALLADLHAAVVQEPDHRRDVLVALADAYHAAEELTKTLGIPGLPVLAASHLQSVAEKLEEPAYLGLAAWVRGIAIGSTSRDRTLALSRRAADELSPSLDDPAVGQAVGAVHLNAALACAVLGDLDGTGVHLDEAERIAAATDDAEPFGALYFGRDNIGIWRVSLAVEHGEPGRVRELAGRVDPSGVPSKARQAMFYGDLGRGLGTERGAEEQAVAALRTAEEIAPSMIRNNYLMRESVADLLRRARRDAGGRELRGLAYRMGMAA